MLEEWCNNCSWWHLKTTHNKLLIACVGGQNLCPWVNWFQLYPPKKNVVDLPCFMVTVTLTLSLSPNNKPSAQAFQKWVVQTIATISFTIIHHHTMCIHLHECISLRKPHISIHVWSSSMDFASESQNFHHIQQWGGWTSTARAGHCRSPAGFSNHLPRQGGRKKRDRRIDQNSLEIYGCLIDV